VCAENFVRLIWCPFDLVTESPNVSGDDCSDMLVPDPVRLAVQAEEPTRLHTGVRVMKIGVLF
jgi:hypothetical protein